MNKHYRLGVITGLVFAFIAFVCLGIVELDPVIHQYYSVTALGANSDPVVHQLLIVNSNGLPSGLSIIPGAGQIPVGNAGGTAYAPVSPSGDATALSSTGALTVSTVNGNTVAFTQSKQGGTPLASSGANPGAVETTLWTQNLTGGTLGVLGQLHCHFYGDWLNNTGGNQTFTLKWKLGAGPTTIATALSGSIATSALTRAWSADAYLMTTGAQNTASAWMVMNQPAGANTGASSGITPVGGGTTTLTNDTSATLAMTLTGTDSVGTTTSSFDLMTAFCTVIK